MALSTNSDVLCCNNIWARKSCVMGKKETAADDGQVHPSLQHHNEVCIVTKHTDPSRLAFEQKEHAADGGTPTDPCHENKSMKHKHMDNIQTTYDIYTTSSSSIP